MAKVGEFFGRFTVVLADYLGLWKAEGGFLDIKSDVARWKGGATGRDNIFLKGDVGTTITVKTKEMSTDILTLLFGGTTTTGGNVGTTDFPTVAAGVATLAHTPANTEISVYGKLSGMRKRFEHQDPIVNAGKFRVVAGTVEVLSPTHDGQRIRVEYAWYSSSAVKWTEDEYHIPSPVTGHMTVLWGGDQPSAAPRRCTIHFTDVYPYAPDLKSGATADNIMDGNDVILECDEESLIEIIFDE